MIGGRVGIALGWRVVTGDAVAVGSVAAAGGGEPAGLPVGLAMADRLATPPVREGVGGIGAIAAKLGGATKLGTGLSTGSAAGRSIRIPAATIRTPAIRPTATEIGRRW